VLTLAHRVTISADVLSREVDGETVLLDLKGEGYYGLDSVGTRIWQLLRGGVGLDDVVAQLSSEYEIDRARLEADLLQLLQELAAAGLVSLAPE
jgi:coenzyme PQQ synthesis protein D (PqqD)